MYKDNRKTEIRVGLISLSGIVLLLAIILLAKGVRITSNNTEVVFEFENSAGITAGSPVVVNGVKRGVITDVYSDNDKVLINAELDVIDDLHDDLTAMITILEVTGGKKIEIIPGNSPNKFDPKNIIKGVGTSDLSSIITTVSNLSDNLSSIVIKLDSIVTNIDLLLADKEFTNHLHAIVSNTSKVTGDLVVIVDKNKESINTTLKSVSDIVAELKTAIQDNKPQIEKIIDNLEVTTNNLDKLLDNADGAINNADKLITDLNQVVTEVKENNGGTLSKLIYDKEFANKMDSLVITIDSLAKHIKMYGINANVRLGSRP